MCSNTSLSSGGGSSGGSGGGGGDNDGIYSKKHKRQRVVKRGPGVAELEKILREQEKRNDLDTVKNEGLCLVSPISASNYQPQSISLPTTVSFASNPKHFNPPSPPKIYANSNLTTNPSSLGGNINNGGRSGFHAMLPTMWNSCETNLDSETFRFPIVLSNGSSNHLISSPPPAKYLFPHIPAVSSSSTAPSAGPCHGREPPSNQTIPYHHSTLWPEEDKMIGEKRARQFSLEIPPVPQFRYQIPTFSAEMRRFDSSFSFGNRSIINLEPSDTISREMRPATSLEPNIKKCNIDNVGASYSNLLLFPSPTTLPSVHTPKTEIHQLNPFSLQESNGESESQHRPTKGGSNQKKQFYSFLLPREELGMEESLNNERSVGTRGDGIDLNLRL